ncbi:hypothetical protein E2P64_06355 [Candidatus Bathyarchaeota archaeon]|nr:hypothetical protein E2P64_06355 [Candidatus Bathyarchaeota archaeon]
MTRRIQRIGVFLGSHLISGILTFFAMYGVANVGLAFQVILLEVSAQYAWLLAALLLYSWVLTLLILPIQAGMQIWSLARLQPTPFLIVYYFRYDATINLPHRFLDPVQSRIGLIAVILVIIGGLVALPVYSFYGTFVLIARFGFTLFTFDFIILFIQGLAVGTSALFVTYFILASFGILVLQWRRRGR